MFVWGTDKDDVDYDLCGFTPTSFRVFKKCMYLREVGEFAHHMLRKLLDTGDAFYDKELAQTLETLSREFPTLSQEDIAETVLLEQRNIEITRKELQRLLRQRKLQENRSTLLATPYRRAMTLSLLQMT